MLPPISEVAEAGSVNRVVCPLVVMKAALRILLSVSTHVRARKENKLAGKVARVQTVSPRLKSVLGVTQSAA
jgi:hypothetical protein